MTTSLKQLPAKVLLHSLRKVGNLEMNLKQRFPETLGLPVMGAYVQLYRQDKYFTTTVSLFNFISTFLPKSDTRMEYKMVAYRRDGRKIGSGVVSLEHGQSAQVALESVIGKPLDEYGFYHVQAKPYSTNTKEVSKIGTTTGQFMTIFVPTDATRQSPQFIHSHKLFQNVPIPYSPYIRNPNYTETLAGREKIEFFFLNPCASQTNICLQILDANTGNEITKFERKINGHGVERIELAKNAIPSNIEIISFVYEFDRRISHMKPIVFHHHPENIITCNHS